MRREQKEGEEDINLKNIPTAQQFPKRRCKVRTNIKIPFFENDLKWTNSLIYQVQNQSQEEII